MSKKNITSLDAIINDVYNESNNINTSEKQNDIKNKLENKNINSKTDENLNTNETDNTSNTTSIINFTELNEIVQQAVPVKTELLTENTTNMNEIKNDFATLIAEKAGSKSDIKDLKKYYSKVFKNVKDYIYYQGGYPKEDSKGKGQKLAELLIMLVPWLEYLGEMPVIEKHLAESGISLKNTIPLENRKGFEFLKEIAFRNQIKDFFTEGSDTQEKICQNTDSLIKDYYENLPDDIKYDKYENPTGLKPAQFNKLVSIVAKRQLDEDKKDEIQDKAVYQLECLAESTNLLKNSILKNE